MKLYVLVCILNDWEYTGIDSINTIEVFKNKENAIKKLKEYVNNDINGEDDWVLDEDCHLNNIDETSIIRVFWKYQENWEAYYEIKIEEMEVQ
jgi:hypothetical protein